jgi:beta-N-acetylhexosaminidase
MSCHLLVPSLDERSPATLSSEVITGRLRGQLGFGGLVLTDDMDMKAISLRFAPGEAAARAVAAGCDGVLQCGGDLDRVHAALEGIVRAIEDETLPATRVDEALARHAALKARYLSEEARRRAPAAPTLRDVIGSAEHALVAEQMRQLA